MGSKRLAVLAIAVITLLVLAGAGAGVVMASSGGGNGDTTDTHGEIAEGHGEAAEGHGDANGGGWNKEDTYRVMNFTVLFVGLFLLLRKPLSKALNSRIEGIQSQLAELETQKKAAEAELAGYNEKLAMLDKEAEKIVADYIKQGEDARDRILKEAESAAEKLEAQAQKNIDNEIVKAKQQLQQEVIAKALTKAEDLIKSKITADDQNRLVDEYLEKVVV